MHWGMFLWVIEKILVTLAAVLVFDMAFLILWAASRRRWRMAESLEERQLREDQRLIERLCLAGKIFLVRANGAVVSKDTASTDWS